MTRDEELRAINEAIEAGKLSRIPISTEITRISFNKPRNAQASQRNAARIAKRNTNLKDREKRYRSLGLDLKTPQP